MSEVPGRIAMDDASVVQEKRKLENEIDLQGWITKRKDTHRLKVEL